jgi:hypothetical protein
MFYGELTVPNNHPDYQHIKRLHDVRVWTERNFPEGGVQDISEDAPLPIQPFQFCIFLKPSIQDYPFREDIHNFKFISPEDYCQLIENLGRRARSLPAVDDYAVSITYFSDYMYRYIDLSE